MEVSGQILKFGGMLVGSWERIRLYYLLGTLADLGRSKSALIAEMEVFEKKFSENV
jgi:hypothetical protein